VAISGLGKVGSELARLLIERGCSLTVADVSPAAIDRVGRMGPVVSVSPDLIHRTECDIFAPCALGGVLNRSSITELHCEGVVGAANNQLESTDIADELNRIGILYVPDFVVNAGGIINIAHEYLGYDEKAARTHVEGIYETTKSILERADEYGITPLAAAMTIAKERLASPDA
jgi:glutamate dehydrogenase/leucine dehydrogenase